MRTITNGRALKSNALWTARLKVVSRTSGRTYIIAKNRRTGEWGCSCAGWRFNRDCKHLHEFCA